MYLQPLSQNNFYTYQSNKQISLANKQLSFGKIEPEMLFIKIPGFDKDYGWANTMIKTIDKTVSVIASGKSCLTDILDGIKNDYQKYFTSKEKNLALCSENSNFGVNRQSELLTYLVGKYHSYFDKASEIVLKDHSIFDEDQICHTITADFDKSIPLTKTLYNLENFEIHWQHTDAKNIPQVMNHSAKVYEEIKDLIKETSKSPDKNIILNKINKKIAELHWYLANATPYERGSAGIIDVLTKSIYESANIQTSPWKEGLSPDMEAFVTPLNEFVEKYPSYFESLPKFIE